MSLSTPGSLDNANYTPTNIPCTLIQQVIYNFDDLEYQLLFHLFTKLNFTTIIKSISIFQRFVLNYKFHHNANFKKDSITIFFKKSSVNFENVLLNQSEFFKDSF